MNNKPTTISRERLEQYAFDKMMCNVNDEIRTMASMLLASMSDTQKPYAWSFEWASCVTTDGPQNFNPCIEREAPPQWAIDEGQARNVVPFYATPTAPVVPDGWVLVPIEPTEDMIIAGFESEPDEIFSEPKVWEAYQVMSGCQQSAHRAKLCWAAMLAAAPEPNASK